MCCARSSVNNYVLGAADKNTPGGGGGGYLFLEGIGASSEETMGRVPCFDSEGGGGRRRRRRGGRARQHSAGISRPGKHCYYFLRNDDDRERLGASGEIAGNGDGGLKEAKMTIFRRGRGGGGGREEKWVWWS